MFIFTKSLDAADRFPVYISINGLAELSINKTITGHKTRVTSQKQPVHAHILYILKLKKQPNIFDLEVQFPNIHTYFLTPEPVW